MQTSAMNRKLKIAFLSLLVLFTIAAARQPA